MNKKIFFSNLYFILLFLAITIPSIVLGEMTQDTHYENYTGISPQNLPPPDGNLVYTYSPSGFSLYQPEELFASIGEFGEHTTHIFTNNNNISVLTVDVAKTNKPLSEIISDQKKIIEDKTKFNLISEKETTIAGISAYEIIFSYIPEENIEKEVRQIITVKEGNQYLLMTESINGDTKGSEIGKNMINSFTFIPISDDDISKMVKSKFKKSIKPDKSFCLYCSNGYNPYLNYSWTEMYVWRYITEWYYVEITYVDYYCFCW